MVFTHEQFEKLVAEGINNIDEKFLTKLNNIDIVIEDEPTSFQLEKLNLRGSVLFGLYEGIPLTQRSSYGMVLPDKITIFKNAMERTFHTASDIKKAVTSTVWHEIAHHFGMSEKEVRKAENNRRHSH